MGCAIERRMLFVFSNWRKAEYNADGRRWGDEVVGVCGSSPLIAPILPGK